MLLLMLLLLLLRLSSTMTSRNAFAADSTTASDTSRPMTLVETWNVVDAPPPVASLMDATSSTFGTGAARMRRIPVMRRSS
ncbi:MAG: hypothetical protein B7Z66_14555 [Chromatiales bacterium 21-64-14]|nr:MAG: hypothetical protein B7Z66_14555 [Chromatiales bacterium 21-64-14]